MSTPNQRAFWRQCATWLTQLGRGAADSALVDAVGEVADALLALLEEVSCLERDRDEARRIGAWLYDHSPGTRHFLGDVSEWPWLLDDVVDVQEPGGTTPQHEAP